MDLNEMENEVLYVWVNNCPGFTWRVTRRASDLIGGPLLCVELAAEEMQHVVVAIHASGYHGTYGLHWKWTATVYSIVKEREMYPQYSATGHSLQDSIAQIRKKINDDADVLLQKIKYTESIKSLFVK